ncbi:hypothetical protein ABEW59_25000 [Bacillus wiedmannii]|uniref:hypothetical protein n=1 Tax=Bacillus wiedmannii TaxID=1890302 RepID=UPI003D1CA577
MDFKEALEHLDVICERQGTNRILFNFKFNEMKIIILVRLFQRIFLGQLVNLFLLRKNQAYQKQEYFLIS